VKEFLAFEATSWKNGLRRACPKVAIRLRRPILSTLPILWRGLSGTSITGNLKAPPGEGWDIRDLRRKRSISRLFGSNTFLVRRSHFRRTPKKACNSRAAMYCSTRLTQSHRVTGNGYSFMGTGIVGFQRFVPGLQTMKSHHRASRLNSRAFFFQSGHGRGVVPCPAGLPCRSLGRNQEGPQGSSRGGRPNEQGLRNAGVKCPPFTD